MKKLAAILMAVILMLSSAAVYAACPSQGDKPACGAKAEGEKKDGECKKDGEKKCEKEQNQEQKQENSEQAS